MTVLTTDYRVQADSGTAVAWTSGQIPTILARNYRCASIQSEAGVAVTYVDSFTRYVLHTIRDQLPAVSFDPLLNRIRQASATVPAPERATRQRELDPFIALLEEWTRSPSDYEDYAWPRLRKALEQNRLSPRPRLRDE